MTNFVAPLLDNPNFSERLVFDISLALEGSGDALPDILKRHNMGKGDLAALNLDPLFLKRVSDVRLELKEKGLTFKAKARIQAEELLSTSWLLIHDADVSAAVKADLIKSTVKWAGLEPKGEQIGDAGGGGGVRIMINMGPQGPAVIDVPVIEVSNGQVIGK